MRGLLPLIATAAFSFGACDNIDNFDVPVKGRTTISGAGAIEMLLGEVPQAEGFTRVDLTQSQTFKNEKYSVEDVDSVRLTRMTMYTIEPASQDLSFFGSVIFYAEVASLPRKEIARREGFPRGSTRVDFTVTADDLKDYLLAKEATITAEIGDSKRPPQQTTIEVEAVFDIDVNVL